MRGTERDPAGAALLAAVLASPDDDGPRLVLADHLMQRGDPRGELIAVQCRLSSGDAAAADRIELEARERSLLAEHQVEWLRPLGLEPSRAGWRRGFVERVQGDWGWFRGAFADLAARTPLRHVRVYHVDIAEACALAWPASVVSLAMFSGDFGASEARVLADARSLDRLRRLELFQCEIGDEGARALASTSAFPRLVELAVSGTDGVHTIGAAGTAALADARELGELELLDLSRNRIGDGGARAIAGSPRMARFQHLILHRCGVGDGARALAASPYLGALRSLWLGSNPLGPLGAAAVAASPHWAQLAELDLGGDELGTDGANLLADRWSLPAVTSLGLAFNQIGSAGAQAIARARGLASLTELRLGNNEIDADGACAIAESAHLRGLESLELRDNPIGVDGVRAIAAELMGLRTLRLARCQLGDAGVAALAGSPALAGLRELAIGANAIGDAGALALAESPFLTSLTALVADGNPIGDLGRSALRSRFGAGVRL